MALALAPSVVQKSIEKWQKSGQTSYLQIRLLIVEARGWQAGSKHNSVAQKGFRRDGTGIPMRMTWEARFSFRTPPVWIRGQST